MCGILGVIGTHRRVDDALRRRFTEGLGVMRGRGPDGYWTYADSHALIGQTLLLITDPAGGLRPYISNDRRIVACVNGEIYNWRALRTALEEQGAQFSSDSDCEVVAHGYALWGERLFEQLDGMFAVAILDREAQSLTLARDLVGIRPLYYTITDGYVAFASEPRVLTTSGLASAEPSQEGLFQSLVLRRSLDPTTMYAQVESVQPGQQLTFDRSGSKTARIYAALPQQVSRRGGEGATVDLDAVREVVGAAVRRRVPEHCMYSLFLSGGLDSTITNRLTPADPRRLPSLVCGFSFDGIIDERQLARSAAAACRIQLSERTVGLEQFLSTWPLLVWAHHEPLMFNSSIPLFLLCREARAQGAKVILSGEGADEMFAGYVQYPVYAQQPDDGTAEYLLRHDVEMNAPGFVIDSWLSDPSWGRKQWQLLQERLDAALPFRGAEHGLARKLEFDRMTFLRGLLMRQDCVGLTTGIEIRVPFLDRQVLDLATRQPAQRHVIDGVGKKLLREAFSPLISPALASVPKVGFPVPVSAWLKYPAFLALCTKLNGRLNATGLLRKDAILAAVARGQADAPQSYKHLWTLLNLAMWWSTLAAPEPPLGMWADLIAEESHAELSSVVADTRHVFAADFLSTQLARRELPAVVLSRGWNTEEVLPLHVFGRPPGAPAPNEAARSAPAP